MATRIPRLARLTLFSGPNCSLCDTAKAELAKIHQTRPFQLSGRGPGTVEEEVCLLDSSATSGRQRGSERSLGRADSDPGSERMGENGEVAQDSFCIDTTSEWATPFLLYERCAETVLGEDEDHTANIHDSDARLCFNCGSPDHAVSSCPNPLNYQLISLSRQLFNFLRSNNRTAEPERIHVVEAWKQQRLEWLDTFEPGEITGSLLREALGLQDGENDGEWLRNMALWGYPKGWVSDNDPREGVRLLIANEGLKSEDEDDQMFVIFGEEDGEERLNISRLTCEAGQIADHIDEQDVSDTASDISPSSSSIESSPGNIIPVTDSQNQRWAKYPPMHFLYTLLPVYNGFSLPPISPSPSRSSATFTDDRRALWDRITASGLRITQEKHNLDVVPPWRLPGAFGPASNVYSDTSSHKYSDPTVLSYQLPPPPPTRPPPLPPPSPPGLPPPPPRPSNGTQPPSRSMPMQLSIAGTLDDTNDELDMDMSDED